MREMQASRILDLERKLEKSLRRVPAYDNLRLELLELGRIEDLIKQEDRLLEEARLAHEHGQSGEEYTDELDTLHEELDPLMETYGIHGDEELIGKLLTVRAELADMKVRYGGDLYKRLQLEKKKLAHLPVVAEEEMRPAIDLVLGLLARKKRSYMYISVDEARELRDKIGEDIQWKLG
jgi:hypothetical protein